MLMGEGVFEFKNQLAAARMPQKSCRGAKQARFVVIAHGTRAQSSWTARPRFGAMVVAVGANLVPTRPLQHANMVAGIVAVDVFDDDMTHSDAQKRGRHAAVTRPDLGMS